MEERRRLADSRKDRDVEWMNSKYLLKGRGIREASGSTKKRARRKRSQGRENENPNSKEVPVRSVKLLGVSAIFPDRGRPEGATGKKGKRKEHCGEKEGGRPRLGWRNWGKTRSEKARSNSIEKVRCQRK